MTTTSPTRPDVCLLQLTSSYVFIVHSILFTKRWLLSRRPVFYDLLFDASWHSAVVSDVGPILKVRKNPQENNKQCFNASKQ